MVITKLSPFRQVLEMVEANAWLVPAGYATGMFYVGLVFPLTIPVAWPLAYCAAVMTRMVKR